MTAELGELRTELAAVIVARDSETGEAAGLRAELDRVAAELATARERIGGQDAGLSEAEALLAEARALTASMRHRGAAVPVL